VDVRLEVLIKKIILLFWILWLSS